MILTIVISTTVVLGCLDIRYGEKSGNIREALSLPFQQTARYLKEHGEDVTEEEKEIISRVLDYEKLAVLYNPDISDPAKFSYRQAVPMEDWTAYLKVWMHQFFRHPMSYVAATVNQNYVLIWPKAEVYGYYTEAVYEDYEPSVRLAEYLGIQEVESPVFRAVAKLQRFYVGTALLLPIWGMTSNIAFYNLLLIFLLVFSVRRKLYRTLLTMMPLLLSVLIVISAPLVTPRYLLPAMYPMPAVLAFYLYELKEKQENASYERQK